MTFARNMIASGTPSYSYELSEIYHTVITLHLLGMVTSSHFTGTLGEMIVDFSSQSWIHWFPLRHPRHGQQLSVLELSFCPTKRTSVSHESTMRTHNKTRYLHVVGRRSCPGCRQNCQDSSRFWLQVVPLVVAFSLLLANQPIEQTTSVLSKSCRYRFNPFGFSKPQEQSKPILPY